MHISGKGGRRCGHDSCVGICVGQRFEEQLGQRRLPVPKAAPVYGLERVQAVNSDLLSFLSGTCIALWHLPQFRTSLITVQVLPDSLITNIQYIQ